jgi:branched-chain amino acid transport system ATP-binding protein
MSAPPVLEVRNASKRYGGVTAVSDITIEVHSGEILGLIGPNGAGKTTLVNLVTGVTSLTHGSIVFQGRPLKGMRPHQIGRMGIARTFQVVRPFANLSVLENVAVGAMYGAGGAARSARAALQHAE